MPSLKENESANEMAQDVREKIMGALKPFYDLTEYIERNCNPPFENDEMGGISWAEIRAARDAYKTLAAREQSDAEQVP